MKYCWSAFFLMMTLWAPNIAAQSMCRTLDYGEARGQIEDPRLDEASGLATSWRNAGILWTHNDSGDSARLFAIDETGAVKGVFTLGVSARDWEDMAVGPCPQAESCVYVADIGDNDNEYPEVRIHRFAEPLVDGTTPPEVEVADVETFTFTYEGGPRNSETLLVHPVSGDVYVVDKTTGDPNGLWRVPLDANPIVARKVASFDLGEVGFIGGRVTGGDFSPDGDEVTIRTYSVVYTFCGADVVQAFQSPPSRIVGFDLFQAETLTYTRDGSAIWVTSEQQGTSTNPIPLVRMAFDQPIEPADVGTSADTGAASQPDAAAPMADAGPPPPDVKIIDEPGPKERGCSCKNAKARTSAGGLGLLVMLVVVGRLRRRQNREAFGALESDEPPEVIVRKSERF